MLILLALTPAHAQTLDALVHNYRKSPTAAGRRALLQYAAAHPKDSHGALAQLAIGVVDVQGKAYADGMSHLMEAAGRLPILADYASYYLGLAYLESKNNSAVSRALMPIWSQAPVSPFGGRAAIVGARNLIELNHPQEALRLLSDNRYRAPQAPAEMVKASALEASGDLAGAVASLQKVYYEYPLSGEARDAAAAADRLRAKLGDAYPEPSGALLLTRAKKLAEGKEYDRARKEIEESLSSLHGSDREVARVRLAAIEYADSDYRKAHGYLTKLPVASPEAESERLYHLVITARRLDYDEQIPPLLDQLGLKYPQSPWRLGALVSAGDLFLLRGRQDVADPIFRACVESFPDDPQTVYCHWRVSWAAYLNRRPDAADLLRTHVRTYPGSEKANAALYFLGRLAENQGDYGAAQAYYAELDRRYPNTYYAMLAREKLSQAAVKRAIASPATVAFLTGIQFPTRNQKLSFDPNPATHQRLERAHLLQMGGFDDWAESELRFGARNDGQPQIIALELARVAERRGSVDQAMRWIKALFPSYITLPLNAAPNSFWRIAFPLPYRDSLERYARMHSIDPFLMAGLIRQESEFNPTVVSYAKAYGLTQILPSTGRSFSRKLGLGNFRLSLLTTPDSNMKIGTYYLRLLADSLNGKWEEALASYNGGRSRVVKWLGWSEYREPAEFIENIPIEQTREYVQIVLRNANVYRTLYGGAGESRRETAAISIPRDLQ